LPTPQKSTEKSGEVFDITDLSVEEVQRQEWKIKCEKARRWSFLHREPGDVELTEQDKERAIKEAIKERKIVEYSQKIYAPREIIKYSAEQLFSAFGRQLKVIPDNENVVKLLCLYFSDDKRFEYKGYSLEKGILLAGGIGCGKTTLMRFFSQNEKQRYMVRSVGYMAKKFAESGFESLNEYSEHAYCFDDLGTEKEIKHFGNETNIMQEIIMQRYERKLMTHITTNLIASDIKEFYGDRAASRLREMCNIITFPQNAKDLRT